MMRAVRDAAWGTAAGCTANAARRFAFHGGVTAAVDALTLKGSCSWRKACVWLCFRL